MTGFNNQAYKSLVEDLIKEVFYVDGRSNRGVIATIRQYAEVIVRRFLNLTDADRVTLGDRDILKEIKSKSNNSALLLNALKAIQDVGNKCTHTQNLDLVTEQDVENAINKLFELYAYLFVDYFEKYGFGRNDNVTSAFSILPPIIRYIALINLYEKDRRNVTIIDKLSLALLKAFDEAKAIEWLNEHIDELRLMPSVTEEAAKDLEREWGKNMAKNIINAAPNMYDLCIDRVKKVAKIIDEKGRLYNDFESAISLYKEKGIIEGNAPEISDFNTLMEFVYLGRKACFNGNLNSKDAYVVMDGIQF